MSVSTVNNSYDYSTQLQSGSSRSTESASAGAGTGANKFNDASDYYAHLQSQYSFVGRSAQLSGISTTVNISDAFLRQSMQDPAKAAYLEENLQAITDAVAMTKSNADAGGYTVNNLIITVDENGNMSAMSSVTKTSEGSSSRPGASKKSEKEEEEERAAEKRAEEKRIEERRQERKEAEAAGTDAPVNGSGDAKAEFSVTTVASSVRELTAQIADTLAGPAASHANGSVVNIRV